MGNGDFIICPGLYLTLQILSNQVLPWSPPHCTYESVPVFF